MRILLQYLAVAAGGAVGSILRLFVSQLSGKFFPTDFPVGTMIINLSGSFFLGWFLTMFSERSIAISPNLRIAIGVGFVGAYTTFSTFMYESSVLMKEESFIKAGANLIGSLILGLIAVFAGMRLAAR